MQEFRGKTAVVTGAASGIGRALARRLAQEQMQLVLADIAAQPLAELERELRNSDHLCQAVVTDVSLASDVEELARKAQESFGKVHLLVNNAGVSRHTGQAIWEVPPVDWDWLLGVNFLGVVHGLRAFVPAMLAHGESAHVVNAVSYAGLICGGGAYGATKQALISLTESLLFDLRRHGSEIGVTCLCPGLVDTAIVESERVRPARWKREPACEPPEWVAYRQNIAEATRRLGVRPEVLAEDILQAIRQNTFYLLSEPAGSEIGERLNCLQSGRAPCAPPRPSQSARRLNSSS